MRLFSKPKRNNASGILGIEFGPQGVAIAQVLRAPDSRPALLSCDYLEGDPGRQAALLQQYVTENALGGLSANVLLHPSEYQIFLLEAPDVQPQELRDAMRWRVKDMISSPLDEVVIDCFALPDDAYRGRTRMVYCAVLEKTRMLRHAQIVGQAGLRMASIDITEMAFRNIGVLAGSAGINLALLRLRTSEGLICIQNGTDLYMARRIEHGLARAAQDIGSLTLEIQRSLDYFESQLGKGYINRLMLLPMKQDEERTFQGLASGLAVNVQRLDLRELFPGQTAADLPEARQAYCLGAVGAGLRQETD